MKTASKTRDREKVNFMLDRSLFLEIKQYVPEGDRSDFANGALSEALILVKRRAAFKQIDKIREKMDLHISMDEFRKLRAYGRE
jgi:hypothetical protein